MKMKQKSRLDSRLVEAFNQLKDIQQNITQTNKAYQSSKKSMQKVEQNIQQLERQLTDSKRLLSEYENKLYQAYRYNEKLKSKLIV